MQKIIKYTMIFLSVFFINAIFINNVKATNIQNDDDNFTSKELNDIIKKINSISLTYNGSNDSNHTGFKTFDNFIITYDTKLNINKPYQIIFYTYSEGITEFVKNIPSNIIYLKGSNSVYREIFATKNDLISFINNLTNQYLGYNYVGKNVSYYDEVYLNDYDFILSTHDLHYRIYTEHTYRGWVSHLEDDIKRSSLFDKAIKFDKANGCDKKGTDVINLKIDYSDFGDEELNYKYEYSLDNSNWLDAREKFGIISTGSIRGVDFIFHELYYNNTTIYARVLDTENNVISSSSIVIDELSNFDNFVSYTFSKDINYAFISGLEQIEIIVPVKFNDIYGGLNYYNAESKQVLQDVNTNEYIKNNQFKKYKLFLTGNTIGILSKSILNEYNDYFTFYVTRGAFVSFGTYNVTKDDNNNDVVGYDGEYKDLDGNNKDINAVATIIENNENSNIFSPIQSSIKLFKDFIYSIFQFLLYAYNKCNIYIKSTIMIVFTNSVICGLYGLLMRRN